MKVFIIILSVLWSVPTHATTVAYKDITNLVAEAEHILIGKVDRVSMVDWDGNEITNPEARTGPGSNNEIRLHVKVLEDGGVLKTTHTNVPQMLTIPLMKKWHYELGQIKETEGETFIFLLKGDDYKRVYPGLFQRPINEKEKIKALIEDQRMTEQTP